MCMRKRLITYREAINEALIQEMERDPRVFVYGLDMPDHKRIFGTTNQLVERFGKKRCFATPLSEDAMTGFALGAAIGGLRPIHIHIRVDFLLLAMNQLINMLANYRYITGGNIRVPVVIRAIIGRGWGQGAQHSKSLFSLFAHIPGLAARVQEACFGKLKSPVTRIGFAHTPCPTTRPLENKFYPGAIDVIRTVEKKLRLPPLDLTGEQFYSYENKFKGPF